MNNTMVKVKRDLTNCQFGRLMVIKQAEDYIDPNKHRASQWLCRCQCGNILIVTGRNLANGHTKSCGCLKTELTKIRNKKHNKYIIMDDIVYIYFNTDEEYTVINLDKWESIPLIQRLCWGKDNNGYVSANIPKDLQEDFKTTKVYLHRLICPCDDKHEPDHLDRNKLNNLTKNLQPKTRKNNNLNKGLLRNNSSGFTGVYWNKKRKRWIAQITINNKTISLGSFINIEDAVTARLKAEAKYFGEFAPQQHLYEQYGITTTQQNN